MSSRFHDWWHGMPKPPAEIKIQAQSDMDREIASINAATGALADSMGAAADAARAVRAAIGPLDVRTGKPTRVGVEALGEDAGIKITYDRLVGDQCAFANESQEGPELVMGALTGFRMWGISEAGLTGVNQRDVWTPGENVAVCHRRAYVAAADIDEFRRLHPDQDYNVARGYTLSRKYYFRAPCDNYRDAPDCPHGFYAYTHPSGFGTTIPQSADGSPDLYVGGLITAYGTVRQGTKGFICTKAKIRLLISAKPISERVSAFHSPGPGGMYDLARIVNGEVEPTDYDAIPVYPTWRDAFAADPSALDDLRSSQVYKPPTT